MVAQSAGGNVGRKKGEHLKGRQKMERKISGEKKVVRRSVRFAKLQPAQEALKGKKKGAKIGMSSAGGPKAEKKPNPLLLLRGIGERTSNSIKKKKKRKRKRGNRL